MPRTLIIYSTVDGQTLKICRHLQSLLENSGHEVELIEVSKTDTLDLNNYDQIVIGTSIRYGKHHPDVYKFIKSNRPMLDKLPSAFFSVNVVARKSGKDTPETNPYFKRFQKTTTWQPDEAAVFAGKIDYPSYSFWDREIIRLIMRFTNGPTEPNSCIEFTDWQAVEQFAQKIAGMQKVLKDGNR